jgi:hypothetical protein
MWRWERVWTQSRSWARQSEGDVELDEDCYEKRIRQVPVLEDTILPT